MAKKKPEPEPRQTWAQLFAALQDRMGLDNEAMAEQFGVGERTYLSWKYGERNPSKTAIKLYQLLAAK